MDTVGQANFWAGRYAKVLGSWRELNADFRRELNPGFPLRTMEINILIHLASITKTVGMPADDERIQWSQPILTRKRGSSRRPAAHRPRGPLAKQGASGE